jgi:hypothetical protein
MARLASSTAVAGVALLCGGAFPLSAGAQTVTQEIVVSVGGTVASNPYYDEADAGASVGGTFEIRPRVTYDTSITRFDLEAFAQGTAFVEDYGFEDNYGAFANINHRASERLSLQVNAGATSTASPIYNELWTTGGLGAGPDEPLPPAPFDDITVLGQRGRNTSISAGAGGEYIIDAQNRLAFAGSYETVMLTHPGAEDYDVAQVNGRYSRVLNERATVGLAAAYQQFNYDDALVPDGRTMSVLGSLTLRLDEVWTLSADAGVQRTRLEAGATAPAFNNTSLTANASLCRNDQREGFCVNFSRESRPTAYAGVRSTNAGSFSYRLRTSEYGSLTLGGGYSRSSGLDGGLAAVPATSLVSVRGGYEHRLNERLSGYVEASGDRLRGSTISSDPRARFGIGIRYRFGRAQ